MKWLPRSIRWRIQLWHGLLLLGVLVGFAITAYRLQAANAYRQMDRELAERISLLSRALEQQGDGERPPPPEPEDSFHPGDRRPPPPPRADGPPDEPEAFGTGPRPGGFPWPSHVTDHFSQEGADGFFYAIWSREGGLMGKSAHAPSSLERPAPEPKDQTRSREGFREQYHFTPPGECLLAGVSEAAMQRELRVLARRLALLGGAVWLAGLAGGWWLASRAIAPLGAISATARRIADGQLHERIPAAEAEGELGAVAAVLNETFCRLEQAFTRQARFTSDAAHELRTPVSIVLAQAQLSLSRVRTGEEYRETLTTIQRSAHRMRSLVESLLQLAMLDSSAVSFRHQPCDLAELAREQMELVGPLAAERGIVLQAQCERAPCVGDADRLAQIFTNLLANAVKYCRAGDIVNISTGRVDGHVVAQVADTGPGIGTEHLPHVFERFYRADASRNRATGGAGLGLAICQTIADAHGGEIAVRPGEEKGVTFTLRLPAAGRTESHAS